MFRRILRYAKSRPRVCARTHSRTHAHVISAAGALEKSRARARVQPRRSPVTFVTIVARGDQLIVGTRACSTVGSRPAAAPSTRLCSSVVPRVSRTRFRARFFLTSPGDRRPNVGPRPPSTPRACRGIASSEECQEPCKCTYSPTAIVPGSRCWKDTVTSRVTCARGAPMTSPEGVAVPSMHVPAGLGHAVTPSRPCRDLRHVF